MESIVDLNLKVAKNFHYDERWPSPSPRVTAAIKFEPHARFGARLGSSTICAQSQSGGFGYDSFTNVLIVTSSSCGEVSSQIEAA